MKIYADLEMVGPPEILRTLLNSEPPQGWERDVQAEDDLNRVELSVGPGSRMYVYKSVHHGLPKSDVFVFLKNAGRAYVSNIVPCPESGVRGLSRDQYNEILRRFRDEVISGSRYGSQIRLEMGKEELILEDLVSPAAAQLLRQFSGLANKETGSSHPRDRQRWVAFLQAVAKEGTSLSPGQLGQWLHEEAGWSEDVASELASEYELAIDVAKGLVKPA